MSNTPTRRGQRGVRRASQSNLLQADVAAMIRDTAQEYDRPGSAEELAHDIIVVVRERVLREIGTYARENVR